MRKNFENYTLLTGNHGRRGSLWKGEDHLLAVEGRGILFPFSEQYRRVDYKNIQAISYTLTRRYWIIFFALLIPILGLAGGAALAVSAALHPLAITLGVVMLPFVCMLGLHLSLGKTCVCTLQTAVQNMRLRPLTRIEKAKRVMGEIEALCLLHQGALPSDLPVAAIPTEPDNTVPGTKPLWQGSLWVTAAGVTLTLMTVTFVLFGAALVAGIANRQHSFGVLYTDALLGMLALICSIAGLAKALKTQPPDGLLATLWTSLGLEVITGGAIYLLVVFHSMAQSESAGESRQVFARLFSLAELSPERMQVAGWIVIGLGCLFALPGLILMFYGFQKKAPHPNPSNSPLGPPSL